jgi:hypothetical protein
MAYSITINSKTHGQALASRSSETLITIVPSLPDPRAGSGNIEASRPTNTRASTACERLSEVGK